MDCARSAIRQGASSVSVAYRGPEERMSASPKEKQAAQDEGVTFLFDHQALEILGTELVAGISFKHDDKDSVIQCDVIIFAIGQINKTENWMTRLGIASNTGGEIITNQQGQTSHEKIYAGGDNTHGPDLVVTAIAAGRRAARGMLESFQLKQQIIQQLSQFRRRYTAHAIEKTYVD